MRENYEIREYLESSGRNQSVSKRANVETDWNTVREGKGQGKSTRHFMIRAPIRPSVDFKYHELYNITSIIRTAI